jgi:glycine dehydrogenase subunit 1
MVELGEAIAARANYAINCIGRIEGLKTPVLTGAHFKEFVVNFDELGLDVSAVNKTLYQEHGIVGGKDLSKEHPELGQSALYCITEIHSLKDIEKLTAALSQIAKGGGADV